MANNERVAKLLLRIQTDRAATQRTQRELQTVLTDLRQFDKQTTSLDLATRKVTQAQLQQAQATRKVADETRRAKEETKQHLAFLQQMTTAGGNVVGSRAGGASKLVGGRGSALATFGTELRAMPAVGTPLGVSTDVFAKILNVFGRLSPVAAGAGLAVAGAAAALVLLADNANKVREAAKADLDARTEALKLLKDGTKEEVQARIAELQKKQEINRLIAEDANRTVQQVRQGIREQSGVGGAILSDFNAAIGTGAGELRAAKDNADAANKALAETSVELNLLQQGAENAGNAFAELKKRMDEAAPSIIAAADETRQLELLRAQSAGMTLEELRKNIASRNQEIAALDESTRVLQASGNTSTAVSKQIADNIAKVSLLNREIDVLLAESPIAERIDAMKKAEEAAKEFTDAAAKAAEAQETYNQKLNDIASEVLSRIAEAARDRDRALAEAFRDAEADRAKIIADVRDQLNEAEQEALEERQEAERDHQKRIQQIIKDGSRDQQTAIEDRDAVALARAQQAQQDAIDEENDAHADRLRDIDRALAKENQQINKRYLEQLQAVDARLAEQTRRTVERYNEQVRAAILYGNEQRRLAQQHLQQQLRDLQQALTGDLQLRNQAYRAMMQGAQVFADWMLAQAAKIRAAASGNTNQSAGQGRNRPSPFAQGISRGLTPAFKDILVGENGPEMMRLPTRAGVFTPQQYMRAGGATVNVMPGGVIIQGSKLDAFQLEKAVTQGLQRFVKAAQ